MSKASVLIAGCGDVGCALARELRAAGFDVAGLRRRVDALPPGITPVAADLCDAAALSRALVRSWDFVVFAGAPDRFDLQAYRRVYLDGLGNLLGALRGEPRVLLVSSTGVYDQHDGEWVNEDSRADAAGFSGRTLLAAEDLLRIRVGRLGTIVRFGGIYGPGRERLLREVAAGIGCPREPVRYTNRIHRDDCAGALHFLIEALHDGKALAPLYLGVDNEPAPMWEVRQWIASRLGVSLRVDAPASADDRAPGSKRCDNRRLRAAGYVLRYPDFRTGYAPLIAAFRAAGPS